MSVETLLAQLNSRPESVEFEQVIETIAAHYDYSPTRFSNGDAVNEEGSNEGSCKIFAFAKLNGLNETQTLACFGRFYRDDVLGNPDGSDHGNIRNFIQHGWQGIQFDQQALTEKA
jgi:hypothetical protein